MEKFFGRFVRAKWPCVLERHRKIGKLWWWSPYTRKETRENVLTTRASPSLTSLVSCMPRALKKDARKYLNQRWRVPGAVWSAAVQTKLSIFFTPHQLSWNHGSIPNTHMFCRHHLNVEQRLLRTERWLTAALVRPCVQKRVARQVLLATSTESGPEVDQGPSGVITSPALLGHVLVWIQQNYLSLLFTMMHYKSS